MIPFSGLLFFYLLFLGLLAAVVMFIGHYNLIEKVLTAIVVFMGVVFLVTARASNPDWGAIVSGMFTPQLPTNNSTGLMTAIGLVGTTIVPYNLFLHASSAAERWKDPEQISDARFDAVLSIALGGIISMAILVCAAANLHPLWTTWEVDGATVAGITTAAGDQIASAKINGQVMALALTPLLGDWSTWMIGLGLLAAGFSSAITAPLSAAYAVNGVLGWGKGLKDAKFKIVWAIDIHTVAISHGEGRFVASDEVIAQMKAAGQIATQYVDAAGEPSMALGANPNGSVLAIEGITSPDGRIFGKMGHSERSGAGLYKNVPGDKYQPLFEGGVSYFA